MKEGDVIFFRTDEDSLMYTIKQNHKGWFLEGKNCDNDAVFNVYKIFSPHTFCHCTVGRGLFPYHRNLEHLCVTIKQLRGLYQTVTQNHALYKIQSLQDRIIM